jgi:trk system potassium uptake protein TrkH
VIRPDLLLHIVGQFLAMLAASMLVPLGVAVATRDSGLFPIGMSVLLTSVAAALLVLTSKRRSGELSLREGLLVVVALWVAVSAFGCLPFYLSPHFPSLADAFFESMSGFSTTGATVLDKVEVLPPSLHFWRCFTHWLGGMGIVVLGIAILPLLGVGGMHMYRAEFSGARSEKLTPRIAETAAALWKIYVALTLAEYIALRLAGMSTFEAILHSFSTLGTGGFSNRTASVGGFNSPAIEYIVILFMILGGVNFAMQYRLFVERRAQRFFGDIEIRAYFGVIAAATVAVTASLIVNTAYSFENGLRTALFQVSSIMTTTGFVTADFEQWSSFSQLTLLALMFIGGCTGSTAGGLKIMRIVLLMRIVGREFKRIVHRRGVFAVRLGEQVIPESAVQGLLNMVYLGFLINFSACLVIAATGVDILTCISAVASCMFNVGPALGAAGPAEHYGHLPALAKWVLSACMLAGRLEFYTAVVVLTPTFWRR